MTVTEERRAGWSDGLWIQGWNERSYRAPVGRVMVRDAVMVKTKTHLLITFLHVYLSQKMFSCDPLTAVVWVDCCLSAKILLAADDDGIGLAYQDATKGLTPNWFLQVYMLTFNSSNINIIFLSTSAFCQPLFLPVMIILCATHQTHCRDCGDGFFT